MSKLAVKKAMINILFLRGILLLNIMVLLSTKTIAVLDISILGDVSYISTEG